MTNFVDGKRFKSISEKLVHVPLSGTTKVVLKSPTDSKGLPVTVDLSPPGICVVAASATRSGMQFITLKGVRPGETTMSARATNGSLQDFVRIHVHMPRIRQLPEYGKLSAHYAGDEEASDDFRKRIGGAIDDPGLLNTCTMRLSEAFNEAGHPIPRGRADLVTKTDSHGKAYAIRVAEFKRYLLRSYGVADLVRTATANQAQGVSKEDFANLAGVICFEVKFQDATGHFTLWNGHQAVHGDYFAQAYRVSLWVAG